MSTRFLKHGTKNTHRSNKDFAQRETKEPSDQVVVPSQWNSPVRGTQADVSWFVSSNCKQTGFIISKDVVFLNKCYKVFSNRKIDKTTNYMLLRSRNAYVYNIILRLCISESGACVEGFLIQWSWHHSPSWKALPVVKPLPCFHEGQDVNALGGTVSIDFITIMHATVRCETLDHSETSMASRGWTAIIRMWTKIWGCIVILKERGEFEMLASLDSQQNPCIKTPKLRKVQ